MENAVDEKNTCHVQDSFAWKENGALTEWNDGGGGGGIQFQVSGILIEKDLFAYNSE